jgi:hypothetical protein
VAERLANVENVRASQLLMRRRPRAFELPGSLAAPSRHSSNAHASPARARSVLISRPQTQSELPELPFWQALTLRAASGVKLATDAIGNVAASASDMPPECWQNVALPSFNSGNNSRSTTSSTM